MHPLIEICFDRMIRWMSPEMRKAALDNARKNRRLCHGFRISADGLRKGSSSLASRIFKLTFAGDPSVSLWYQTVKTSRQPRLLGVSAVSSNETEFNLEETPADNTEISIPENFKEDFEINPQSGFSSLMAFVFEKLTIKIHEGKLDDSAIEFCALEVLENIFRIFECIPAMAQLVQEVKAEVAEKAASEPLSSLAKKNAPPEEKSISEKPSTPAPTVPHSEHSQPPGEPTPLAEAVQSVLPKMKKAGTLSTRPTQRAKTAKRKTAKSKDEASQQPSGVRSIQEAATTKRPPVRLVFPREPFLKPLDPPAHGMKRAVGYVRKLGTFWNFYPCFLYERGFYRAIDPADARNRYPRYGGFNLFSPSQKNFSADVHYVLDWHDGDMRPNIDAATHAVRTDFEMRIDADAALGEKRLRPLSQAGAFIVVYPDPQKEEPLDFYKTIAVSLSADKYVPVHLLGNACNSIRALLRVGDRLYGPFKLTSDRYQRHYVNFNLASKLGLAEGFDLSASKIGIVQISEGCNGADWTWEQVELDVAFAAGAEPVVFDLYSDEALIKKFASSLETAAPEALALNGLIEKHAAENECLTSDPDIRAARIARIQAAVDETISAEARDCRTAEILAAAAGRDDAYGAQLREHAAEAVLSSDRLRQKLETHPLIVETIQAKQAELDKLKDKIELGQAELAEKKASHAAAVRRFEKEETAYERKIEDMRELYGALVDSKNKKELHRLLEAEASAAEERRDRAEAQRRQFEEQIDSLDEKLRTTVEQARNYAFDGAIAAKFQRAAAHWAKREESARAGLRAESFSKLPTLDLEGRALIDHLVDVVSRYRSYDRNTIVNLFLTIRQNFLTIFAGAPGTGKTSAARILAHAMGLSSIHAQAAEYPGLTIDGDACEADRFLSISVERGWTSKRDFIGFFNTLTQSFESPDSRRHEAFRLLDAENRQKFNELPFVMLLDEANLSPMEFYWADFMDIADRRTAASSILLGGGLRCAVPDTLRFIATINNDFTTENLSPRLIDRAAVVTLPAAKVGSYLQPPPEPDEDDYVPLVSWTKMCSTFNPLPLSKEAEKRMSTMLGTAFESFDAAGAPVSPRTQAAILRHIAAGTAVFEPDGGRSPLQIAVDFALMQKLLPKVNGTGEAWHQALEAVRELAVRERLDLCGACLEKILKRGDSELGDYGYL